MKKGMTLIEILVASTILILGISGVLTSLVSCDELNRRYTHMTNATHVVNKVFEGVTRRETLTSIKIFIETVLSTGDGDYGVFKMPVGNGTEKEYYIELDLVDKLYPTTAEIVPVIEARVSWDGTFVQYDSPNSIHMTLVPFDPLRSPTAMD